MKRRIEVIIPSDWPFEHIPTYGYDEDGDLEVDNFTCQECKFFGDKCKCIDHNYVHFSRPWFSCDKLREHHTICRAFEPDFSKYPAGCLEWDAIGSFDEWHKIWRKQWHYNRNPPWAFISLQRAILVNDKEHDKAKDREPTDDYYLVTYEDFLNCHIMQKDGIRCANFCHIEISRNPKDVTGYKWVSEGPGLWIPWENNKYIKKGGNDFD